MIRPFLSLNLANEEQTLALGAKLGQRLVAGDFIALTGPLGAGKTTLSRGMIRAFIGSQIEVPSPTFTLVQTYTRQQTDVHLTPLDLDLYHFDLYRLQDQDDVWELGWEDIASDVALVEWPDKAGENLPKDRLDIVLSFENNGRKAQLYDHTHVSWKDRLDGV